MSEKWDDEFEDVFRERLSDFEAEPPAEAWASIVAQVQPARPWWKNWYYYLPTIALLVGGVFVFISQFNSDSKLNQEKSQSPDNQVVISRPSTVHRPQKNSNSDSKLNQENPQKLDNQVVISRQSTVDSPQKNANSNSYSYSNSDSKLNQEKSQSIGNQLIVDKQSTVDSRQTTDHRPQGNAKLNTEVADNQVIVNKRATVDSRQTTDHSPQKNSNSNSNSYSNSDSKLNQENPQNIDNQSIVNKQSTVDRGLSTTNIPQENSNSKNQEKPQSLDNQGLTENREKQTIPLLPSPRANILPLVNDLPSKNIEALPQTDSKPRFRTPLWVSFTASPLYTFRTILPNEGDSLVITRFIPQNSFSRQATGFALNFTLEKAINQRFTVFGGANILQTKTADAISYYNPENVSFTVVRSDSARIIVQPNFNSVNATQRSTYQNLALTLGVKYHLGRQRIRQSVALGGGYNWLINEKLTTNELKNKDLQRHNILLTLSYEFDYQVSTRWRLRFAPTAIYYLQPWFQNTAIYQTRPYHLSFQLGASYRLK